MNSKIVLQMGPKIRLPLDYIRGTEAQRFAIATKLTDDLFQKIKDLYVIRSDDSYITKTVGVSAKIIEEKIQEILPKPLNIHISEFQNKYKADRRNACGTIFYKCKIVSDGIYSVYEQSIKMSLSKDKKVCCENIHILIHEFRHIMDYITNPKIAIRDIKYIANGNLFNSLVFKYINIEKKFNIFNRIGFNYKLDRQMHKLPDELKVDVMKHMRYLIKTELNAYSKSLKYQTIIDSNLGINGNWKTDKQRLSEFDFDRKLKFINRKLYREIKKIRKKLQNI